MRAAFPAVKVLALPENLGFGGGSNAGFRAAKNDIVVLLNSDMRVAPDFLAPLLEGFRDPDVFAVSCQIFFSDPNKLREETGPDAGLVAGWRAARAAPHRLRNQGSVSRASTAAAARARSTGDKFLELGGFDPLLEPFYLEDTDLGYMAWKRGWKVLYQPRSIVYHEHRGTIGKKFREDHIQAVLKKNFLLFCWKNIHEWRRLGSHFFFTWAGRVLAVIFGEVHGRPNFARSGARFRQLPQAIAVAMARAQPGAGRRHRGVPCGRWAATIRDRFDAMDRAPERLRVLFVSPYPICPPVHGGGVFMYQTLRRAGDAGGDARRRAARLAVAGERTNAGAARVLRVGGVAGAAVERCAGGDRAAAARGRGVRQRRPGLADPPADLSQADRRGAVGIHATWRSIAASTGGSRRRCSSTTSTSSRSARGLGHATGAFDGLKARMEYLRALRYELRALPRFDQVQVCTPANRDYLLGFRPELAARMRAGLRAGIDTARYEFRDCGREPLTMLFVGSFRHDPNRVAMDWFVNDVLPLILARQPRGEAGGGGLRSAAGARLCGLRGRAARCSGSWTMCASRCSRYAVFVCPILSGSGVRVKLLEAFAAGIPVVSTRVGAEGLAAKDGEFCALADDPAGFAERVLALFENPRAAAEMAARARAEVEANWDMGAITAKLVESYREMVKEKRAATSFSGSGPS